MDFLDKQMNIKDSYCQQGQHFVKDEDITYLILPTGKKRRMCQACVDKTTKLRKISASKRDRDAALAIR